MWEIVEGVLYIDPQREREFDFCPVCGGERYAPGFRCPECGGDGL